MKNNYFITYFWIILFLFAPFLTLSAQNLDSLWNIWNDHNIPDSIRLDAHANLIQQGYLYAKIDTALVMIEENMSLAQEKGTATNKGDALAILGIYHARTNKLKEALEYFNQAQDIFLTTNDINKQLNIKTYIGRCFLEMKNMPKVLEKFKEILKIASEEDIPYYIMYAKGVIGTYHMDNGSTKVAIEYFKDILNLAKKTKNKKKESNTYITLGIMEERAKNYEEAEKYFKASHKINLEQNDLYTMTLSFSNLARITSLKGDSILALTYFKKSLQITDIENDWSSKSVILREVIKFYLDRNDIISAKPYVIELEKIMLEKRSSQGKAYTYLYVGILKMAEKKYEKALNSCKKAREILLESKINEDLQDACNCIYEAEKKLGNNKAALSALEEYLIIRDTLFNEDRELSFARLTTEYQFEKEKQITDTTYQANLERQSLIQKGLGIGLALLGLLAFFIFRAYKIKNKANQLLAAKNKEIKSQKEQLEQLNQTKDRIFAILGHDMRKPTLAFRGIARKVSYLLGKKDYDRLEQLGESIERDALGLNSLTDNLLNWALTQKNALPYQPEQIQLTGIVEEVFMTLGRLAEDKNIYLESKIMDNTIVMADRNALLTIVRNLVDNAIKFTPENGQITITSKPSDVGVDISIKDTGVGIGAEKAKTIFLLQKGKSTAGTSGEKGTGLGLHLVHELVKLNEGNISVASKQGEGTEFCVSLKAA